MSLGFRPVEIVSITAEANPHEDKVNLNVALANAPRLEAGRKPTYAPLSHRISSAVHRGRPAALSSSPGRVTVNDVRRVDIVDAVNAICRVVADFNKDLPLILAEHRREVEAQEARKAAERERLAADQKIIDETIDRVLRGAAPGRWDRKTQFGMLVAGIDGCKGGWLVVTVQVEAEGAQTVECVPDLSRILADLDSGRLAAAAIDIPIGLPDVGPRRCDILARQLIGPREFCLSCSSAECPRLKHI